MSAPGQKDGSNDKNNKKENNKNNYIIAEINIKEEDVAPPPIQQEQKIENIGYNCSECSSLIEILSIDEDENCLSYKCTDGHDMDKIRIKDYLDKMKKYLDNKNLKDICEKHNKEYICYCFDCKNHLCNDCIQTKIHKKHNKEYISKIKPDEEDIDIIKDRIKYYKNEMEKIKREKEKRMKEIKDELNNNKIKENKRIEKLIKMNKRKEKEELKENNNKYINDIEEIKKRYEEEIKLRKIKYEIVNNDIINKYKMIKNKIITKNDKIKYHK